MRAKRTTRSGVFALLFALISGGHVGADTEIDGATPFRRIRPTFGPYRAFQINVGADGVNIPGDASAQATIAMQAGRSGHLATAFRTFPVASVYYGEVSYAYSRNGGRKWTWPGSIAPGSERGPCRIEADIRGLMYLTSLAEFGCGRIAISEDGGMTWSAERNMPLGEGHAVCIDNTGGSADGTIYGMCSTRILCNSGTITRSTDRGQTFPLIAAAGELGFGDAGVGLDGTLYVLSARQSTFSDFRVTRFPDIQFPGVSNPTFTSSPVNLGGFAYLFGPGRRSAGFLTFAVSPIAPGEIYACAATTPGGANDDPADIMFARSTNGGISWTAPVRLNQPTNYFQCWQFLPTLSVAPSGRLDLVWYDLRANGGVEGWKTQLMYRSSSDGGLQWSGETQLTPVFESNLGMPASHPTIATSMAGHFSGLTSDDLGANVAFFATFNGEQDVWYLRVGPADCNGNGIADADDIANGTSLDCNGDGVPNECDGDCNANGMPDGCDISLGVSLDCNANGTPDDCDLRVGFSLDCNANGIPDECDIASGVEQDCNADGYPDMCDVRDGYSPDCNLNGRPDECDIALGDATDCNANNTPDACDIDNGFSTDCNENLLPDSCDLASGTSSDCNRNNQLDECDLNQGLDRDCNGNGRLDSCDLALLTAFESPPTSPFGNGATGVYSMSLPPAAGDVSVVVEARADLSSSSETVTVAIGGSDVATLFVSAGSDCAQPFSVDGLTLPASAFNALRGEPETAVTLTPSLGVNPLQCANPPSFGRVRFEYAVASSEDDNGNGVPDECEGRPGDLNCDGVVSHSDIAPFVLALTNADGYEAQFPNCDIWQADVNGNSGINVGDIAPFVMLLTK